VPRPRPVRRTCAAEESPSERTCPRAGVRLGSAANRTAWPSSVTRPAPLVIVPNTSGEDRGGGRVGGPAVARDRAVPVGGSRAADAQFTLVLREHGGAAADVLGGVRAQRGRVGAGQLGGEVDRLQSGNRFPCLRRQRPQCPPGAVAPWVLAALVVVAAPGGDGAYVGEVHGPESGIGAGTSAVVIPPGLQVGHPEQHGLGDAELRGRRGERALALLIGRVGLGRSWCRDGQPGRPGRERAKGVAATDALHQWNVASHRLWPVGESGQVPAISEPSV
jgi:hypothetical protein